MTRHEAISRCGPGCNHSQPLLKMKTRRNSIPKLVLTVLVGLVLLPTYTVTWVLAWPYQITKGVLDCYIAHARSMNL